jgi:hypothetical protein
MSVQVAGYTHNAGNLTARVSWFSGLPLAYPAVHFLAARFLAARAASTRIS